MTRVAGVDACPGGWVAVVLDDEADRPELCWGPVLSELVGGLGPLDCVAVDIPIGLPDASHRQADLLVQSLLGPRRASLFVTATRAACAAVTFAEANALQRSLTGKGLSQQSYRIGVKVLETDAFVREGSHRVVEAHPELSFARMGVGPLAASKKTWAGHAARRLLLKENGIDVDVLRGEAGLAAPDDVLDAAAVAWTARRCARGEGSSYPGVAEVFSDGVPAAIWA